MIRINNIKLKPGYTNRDLEAEIKRLGTSFAS